MFTIEQSEIAGFISVKFKYHTSYVSRMRSLPSARFDPVNKRWLVPLGIFQANEIKFQGELYYKTPRWRLFNLPMPDYSAQYKLENDFQLPVMKETLFNYQEYGVKFMLNKLHKQGYIINADDVGLGKTAQTIATIVWYAKAMGMNMNVLVICKRTLRTQWLSEVAKFSDTNGIVMHNIRGTPSKRKKIYKQIADEYKSGLVCISAVSYQTAVKDESIISAMNLDLAAIDEAHKVKAKDGVMNNSLKRMLANVKLKIALTGTPIESRPDDIFGIMNMLDDKYFGDWKTFEKRYICFEYSRRYRNVYGYKNLDELRNRITDIIIRRTEYEVEVDLPETVGSKCQAVCDETQVKIIRLIHQDKQELIEQQSKLLAKARQQGTLSPEDANLLAVYEAREKGLLAAEQAVANDPRLFLMSTSKAMVQRYGSLVPEDYAMSNKTELSIAYADKIVDSGKKLIIFTRFERCARMLSYDIKKELKIDALLYTGEVSDDEREKNKILFQTDDDYPIIIGTDALSEGLNLQVANYVFLFDQPDTPAIKTQRIGRARRVGSVHDTVFYYDFLTENSKDISKYEDNERKRDTQGSMYELSEAESIALKNVMNGG